jgi:hypothetical protein
MDGGAEGPDRSPRTVGDLKKAVRSEGGALAHPLFKTPCCRWWLDGIVGWFENRWHMRKDHDTLW